LNLEERINSSIRDIKDFPKKGIIFKDITPVLKDPILSLDIINELSSYISSSVTHVVGIESRGFLFGLPVAIAKGCSFVLIRKKGKLPFKTVGLKYDLEYASAEIEMNIDSVGSGDKVIIHDDLLATGGTALAAAKLIESQGGSVVGFSFLVELSSLKGRELLSEHSSNVNSLIEY
jgi:adenine phosphoribosyltransferase